LLGRRREDYGGWLDKVIGTYLLPCLQESFYIEWHLLLLELRRVRANLNRYGSGAHGRLFSRVE
jgi:hypothetical protein